jgi:hypothetical protein
VRNTALQGRIGGFPVCHVIQRLEHGGERLILDIVQDVQATVSTFKFKKPANNDKPNLAVSDIT